MMSHPLLSDLRKRYKRSALVKKYDLSKVEYVSLYLMAKRNRFKVKELCRMLACSRATFYRKQKVLFEKLGVDERYEAQLLFLSHEKQNFF